MALIARAAEDEALEGAGAAATDAGLDTCGKHEWSSFSFPARELTFRTMLCIVICQYAALVSP